MSPELADGFLTADHQGSPVYWILSNIFSVFLEIIMWVFFFFNSIDTMCYINWLSDVKPTLHSGINAI